MDQIIPKFETYSEIEKLIDSFDKEHMRVNNFEKRIIQKEAFKREGSN